MAQFPVLTLKGATPGVRFELFVLTLGECMPDGYPCEKHFVGPATVLRHWDEAAGLTSTEYDVDDPRPFAWLGHQINRNTVRSLERVMVCPQVETDESGFMVPVPRYECSVFKPASPHYPKRKVKPLFTCVVYCYNPEQANITARRRAWKQKKIADLDIGHVEVAGKTKSGSNVSFTYNTGSK